MLVLTRQLDQKIVIGEGPAQIEVTLLGIHRGQVQLGVVAPGLCIDRAEVRARRLADQRLIALLKQEPARDGGLAG